jgi:hypothetical protein
LSTHLEVVANHAEWNAATPATSEKDLGYPRVRITTKENLMNRRIALISMTVGLSLMQVVGMSTSGVASASRHAVRPQVQTSPKKPKIDVEGSGGGTQVVKFPTKQEVRGQRALDQISFNWQPALPGWRIRFLGPRKGYLAITFREERRIDVYVRADRTEAAIAHDIAHELGHAVDVSYLTDKDRSTILDIRDLPESTPWWACSACGDLQTGAGDFAETFALIHAPRVKFYSELGAEPTAAMLGEVDKVVVNALTRG